MSTFRTSFAENIFRNKYAQGPHDTWDKLAKRLVDDVCGTRQGTVTCILGKGYRDYLVHLITTMKFIPGGRYLYYAGRPRHNYNNCFMLKATVDTREEWGELCKRSSDALMTGGGIGVEYSVLRGKGAALKGSGGLASGPIPLMNSINEIGRNVMQGGSRRSAIWAALNWKHSDVKAFLSAKDWHSSQIGRQKKRDGTPYTLWDAKQENFNFPAPLDMTNISIGYDDGFLQAVQQFGISDSVFLENVRQALKTGEPGFSFNFGANSEEILRNPCCEVTSADDSDVCNLGSINIANIGSLTEFQSAVEAATMFLICGTMRGDLPYAKVYEVREKNRRIGLGLMGLHEWLLKRGLPYDMHPDLEAWLFSYKAQSRLTADRLSDQLSISKPVACRSIAPTGTIGILAGTTTGVEPLFAVAYKRRYLTDGTRWKYEYVVDGTADYMIKTYGLESYTIETAASLATDPERRIAFQAGVQKYVDMAISSTINLPAWGTEHNNEDKVLPFAEVLAKYAPQLRGFTCYPDGSRGGQPITPVPYEDALKHKGVVYEENDICDISGRGGSCGV